MHFIQHIYAFHISRHFVQGGRFLMKRQGFLGRLYTSSILRMFSRNTPRNTKHSLHTFCISCEFYVLLMLQKNKP